MTKIEIRHGPERSLPDDLSNPHHTGEHRRANTDAAAAIANDSADAFDDNARAPTADVATAHDKKLPVSDEHKKMRDDNYLST